MKDGDRLVSISRRGETFIFIYTNATRTAMLRELGKLAANPESSFTWYEAAIVSQRIRDSVNECDDCFSI